MGKLTVSIIAVMLLLAGAASGIWVGSEYGHYRFIYGAPRMAALRAALANRLGREKMYGQFAQDLWVSEGIAPGKTDGFYLDVGSADGDHISNTRLLDEKGWKGVCIDPFPRNMNKRTCQVFALPVFSESGKHVQFRKAWDLGGIEQDLNAHKQEAEKAPLVDFVTATLDEVLDKAHAPRYIDYMNLDVEGAELDVLKGLNLDR